MDSFRKKKKESPQKPCYLIIKALIKLLCYWCNWFNSNIQGDVFEWAGGARTWVAVQGRVVLAVAACESSGAAALIQAGVWVLASPSVLNNDRENINWLLKNYTQSKYYIYITLQWVDATDLARLVLAGGAVCDPSGAAVEVFEDDFIALDDQLTDAACRAAVSNKYKAFSPS